MGKKNDSSYMINMKLSTVTKWITFGGISCIIIVNILTNVLDYEFFKKYYWVKPILDILNTIGGTLFSAGIVSILVEISTIKGIVSDALNNVLEGNVPLGSYSNSVLGKINKKIAAKRGNVGVEKIDNSIYCLEPKLIELLDGLYYTYYNATYEITPDEENGIFKKSVSLDYEIVNEYGKPNHINYTISLCNIDDNMTDEQKKNQFKINSFKINSTDLTNEVDNYKRIIPIKQKHSEYQYAVKFERELQKCKNHKVHIEFEYNVPIEDLSQIFRLTYPSKSMSHEIYINNNPQWAIHGNAFVSFYCKEDNNNGFHVKQKHNSNLQIEFKNWCIPGAGYVVYLTKNKK